MMGVPARVDSIEMQYIAADPDQPAADGQGASVLVDMTVDVEGEVFAGRARARDILPCCVSAYIDAVSNAQAVRDLRNSNTRKVEAA
jgi:2-isopropylmalate synthase